MTSSSARPHRPWALAARVLLVLAASALVFEGLVRAILFEGWFEFAHPIAKLRHQRYFSRPNEDEHYELQLLLRRDGAIPEAPSRDPLLGWRSMLVRPDFDHKHRPRVADQRPVLLFGDSYAAGVVPEPDLFQSLFEDTELGAAMELVNYGCGGYGLDQICMLAERAVPLWLDQRPVVLVSLLIDDDLDRCRLELRPWPKPRFRVVDGRLELERETLPTTAEHMQGAFPPTKSWGWRLLLHAGILPSGLAERLCGGAASERRAREVCELLLEGTIAELKAHGLPFGFVLFSNRTSILDPASLEWRESLVLEVLARHGVPFVSTRQPLARRMAEDGRPQADYFITEGLGKNHMTRLGNEIALAEMVALIEQLMAGEPPYQAPPRESITRPLELERFARAVLPGKRSAARYDPRNRQLALRVGPKGPTELHYELEGPTSLRLEAWIPSGPNPPAELRGSVDLTVLVDGQALFAARLERGAPPVPLELDLAGPSALVIRAGDGGDDARGDLLVLRRPVPR